MAWALLLVAGLAWGGADDLPAEVRDIVNTARASVRGGAATVPLEIHAHRGASGAAPENTLFSYWEAMRQGADFVELDLMLTSDKELLASHDAALRSTCRDADGRFVNRDIRSMSVKELQEFNCDPYAQLKDGIEPAPTIDNIFEHIANGTIPGREPVRFNIELKGVGWAGQSPIPTRAATVDFVARTVKAIEDHGMANRVMISSFRPAALLEVRRRNAALPLALLKFWGVAKEDLGHGFQYVSPRASYLTAKMVRACHDAGMKVVPWEADTEAAWRRLVALGVDGIITDHPGELRRFLETRR